MPSDLANLRMAVKGQCHRLPPRETGRWPLTGEEEGCGEYAAAEAAKVDFAAPVQPAPRAAQQDPTGPTAPTAAAVPEELPFGAAAAPVARRGKKGATA